MKKKPSRVAPTVADAAISDGKAASAAAFSLSALKEQAAGLRRAQLLANLAHVVTGPDGSFESWSETLPELIGVRAEQIVDSTRKWLDLIHPEDRELFRDHALTARAHGRKTQVEYRLWHRSGKWVHVRQVMELIPGPRDEQGRGRWFNTLQDITTQKLAEQRIRRLNRVYAVLSGINSLIVRARSREELYAQACDLVVRDGNFRMAWIGMVEPGARRVRRAASAGDIRDFFRSERLSLTPGSPAFGLAGEALRDLKPALSQDIQRDPRSVRKKDYEDRGINSLCVIPLVIDGRGIGVVALYAAEVGYFDDEEMRLLLELAGDLAFATEYLEKSERAQYLAYYDPLTGLANRALFHERLEQSIRLAGTEQRKLALLVLDIERFRSVNDSFGRQAGDELLKQVAARLSARLPGAGWVARLSGDVFAIIVPDVASAEELARYIAPRLADLFATPCRVGGEELAVSARVGIALYPGDGADGDVLARNAEAALKKAKGAGERYLFYEQRMTERVSERLGLENKLRRALENGEYLLHYQPKVELATRSVIGVEALLRWNNPELGLVPPLRFVPLLEETGMILEVGSWALRQAAADFRAWTRLGLKVPRIAVNVSAIQLRQRDFVRMVEEAISDGSAAAGIDLELTESLLMEDIEANIEKLNRIRALGLEIFIDDFGTGYSSLAYLAKLPVQALKIDRSFIASMQADANAMTIVSTMISLAHSLHRKVVAEGVETEAQAQILRELACDEMQGYLISRPLPVADLLDWMQQRRAG